MLAACRQSHDRAGKLVLIGEGNQRPLLAREIEQAGLQRNVELTGMIERDSVFESSCERMYSSRFLGRGSAGRRPGAMACRRPVILSDLPPHREIAEGGVFHSAAQAR